MMIIVMVMAAVVLVTDRVSSSLERVRRQLSIKSWFITIPVRRWPQGGAQEAPAQPAGMGKRTRHLR